MFLLCTCILYFFYILCCLFGVIKNDSETKAKTETRECETKTETETSLVNSVAYESKTNRYAFVIDYIFEIINDE